MFVEEECGSGCWCCRGEAREGSLSAVLGGLVGKGVPCFRVWRWAFLVSCVEVGGEGDGVGFGGCLREDICKTFLF